MSTSNDPMAAVNRYIEAFNRGDAAAMAATCSDPMQILDPMPPYVWQGPTACQDWWRHVLARREHMAARGFHVTLDEPRHVDVTGDFAYVVVSAAVTFRLDGSEITQTGSLFTVALCKVDTDWRLSAWTWTKGS